jgi:hypothetical protein
VPSMSLPQHSPPVQSRPPNPVLKTQAAPSILLPPPLAPPTQTRPLSHAEEASCTVDVAAAAELAFRYDGPSGHAIGWTAQLAL